MVYRELDFSKSVFPDTYDNRKGGKEISSIFKEVIKALDQ